MIAVFVNLSTFLVIGKTSPVTYQVLGHLKTCLVLAFGYTLLHDPFTSRNIFGILIAIVGMGMYSLFCTAEAKRKQVGDLCSLSQVYGRIWDFLRINQTFKFGLHKQKGVFIFLKNKLEFFKTEFLEYRRKYKMQ